MSNDYCQITNDNSVSGIPYPESSLRSSIYFSTCIAQDL